MIRPARVLNFQQKSKKYNSANFTKISKPATIKTKPQHLKRPPMKVGCHAERPNREIRIFKTPLLVGLF